MGKQFKGNTNNAGSAILGFDFWGKGTKVTGTYTRDWQSSVGTMYEFAVMSGQPKPTAFLDEKGRVTTKQNGGKETQLERFSIGALKGFGMALQDLENQNIQMKFRDLVTIECIGFQENEDSRKDEMVLFEVTIDR